MKTFPTEPRMWSAFLARDASYDGVFVVAVRTTGIFCRPSCPARKPRRENVEFFPTCQQAILAGYRACRRCRPMDRSGVPPEWVRELLRTVESAPERRLTDADLRAMSVDPARARRYFRSHYGMTFQAYQRSMRLGSALAHLRRGEDLTRVGYGHGFESTSGFRDAFEKLFGAPPGRGRRREALVVRWIDTPIGAFVAGATERGACLFEFADRRALETQVAALRRRLAAPAVPGMNGHLERLEDEVAQYFQGRLRRFRTPLDLAGSEFQERVWRGLLEIPYGETCAYGELAEAIGAPGRARAVGRANGQNRLAVIIPCHRVVRADGHLCGYGGGLWRKQHLLDLEEDVVAGRSRAVPRSERSEARAGSTTDARSCDLAPAAHGAALVRL